MSRPRIIGGDPKDPRCLAEIWGIKQKRRVLPPYEVAISTSSGRVYRGADDYEEAITIAEESAAKGHKATIWHNEGPNPGRVTTINPGERVAEETAAVDEETQAAEKAIAADRAYRERLELAGAVKEITYTRRIEGGAEADMDGHTVFVPGSHLGSKQFAAPIGKSIAGQKAMAAVIEISQGNRLKVSPIVAAEQALKVGDEDTFRVTDVRDGGVVGRFGVGVPAYLPKSLFAHHRTKDLSKAVSAGDVFPVKVEKLRRKRDRRIVVNRKALIPDPWDQISLVKGQTVLAKVENVHPTLGVFLTVDDPSAGQITGLARHDLVPDRPKRGETVMARVHRIQKDRQKIYFSLKLRVGHQGAAS